MKYLSVCSGIEAATVAWHHLGWKPSGFSEVEPFPSAVLSHHYPEVTNFGDMTQFKEWDLGNEAIDILVGGTPCQSFSVAGLRQGLKDPRGNLMLVYLGIAERFRPRWIVWENVPGVLSSNKGRDFGTFLGALVELGYGFAYRVLDAQWFGVAQRRRRVFVVGCFGNATSAAKVLFKSESVCRNPAPSREKGKGVAGNVAPSLTASNDPSRSPQSSEITQQVNAVLNAQLANCLQTSSNDYSRADGFNMVLEDQGGSVINVRQDGTVGTLRSETHGHEPAVIAYGIPGNWIGRKPENGGNAVEPMHDVSPCLTKTDNHGVAYGFEPGIAKREGEPNRFSKEMSPTLRSAMGDNQAAVAFQQNTRDEVRYINGDGQIVGALSAEAGMKQQNYIAQPIPIDSMNHLNRGDSHSFGDFQHGAPSYTLTKGHHHAVAANMAVRRLTPIECERLQGFPDGYTAIPWKKKSADQCPDGPRYKALGNSMAVPVMRWIGERIQNLRKESA
jgi:DNA (cytosine-5)-methyltransferase 1